MSGRDVVCLLFEVAFLAFGIAAARQGLFGGVIVAVMAGMAIGFMVGWMCGESR